MENLILTIHTKEKENSHDVIRRSKTPNKNTVHDSSDYVQSLMVAATLCFLAFLTGCTPSQVNMLANIDEETPILPEQGLVTARVINAGSYPLAFNQLTIAPENVNESEDVKYQRLAAKLPAAGNSTVFASPVDPGRYALQNIRAFYTVGDGWYSRWVQSDATFGAFEVNAGQVTDLGTIIYYPKTTEDKYVDTLLRVPDSSSGEVIDRYFSFHQYDTAAINSWEEDESVDERYFTFASMAQNPVMFSVTHKSGDGKLYFIGKLGSILIRHPDGSWDVDAVDANLDFNTVISSDTHGLLIGGWEGQLYRKLNGGDWENLSKDHQDLNITDLFEMPDSSIGLLGHDETQAFFFQGTGNPIKWRLLNSFDANRGWLRGNGKIETIGSDARIDRRIASVKLLDAQGMQIVRILTAQKKLTSPFAKTKEFLFEVDKTSRKISAIAPGTEPEILTTFNAGALELGVKKPGFWSWTGKPKYYTFNGQTNSWTAITTSLALCSDSVPTPSNMKCDSSTHTKSFQLISVPWFKNSKEALTVAGLREHNYWTSKTKHEQKIVKTFDGGKTWYDTGRELPKAYCSTIIPEVRDRLLISCEGARSDFYESTDEAKTWKQVRYHEEF